MIDEKLAKHWGVSVSEVKEISDFINKFYELAVILIINDSQNFWRGIMYAYDPKNRYILMESKEKFATREQAVIEWSDQIRRQKIPISQAALMRSYQGVPTDVFLALKPVPGYESLIRHRQKKSSIFSQFQKQHS